MTAPPEPPPLRTHQALALDALARAWDAGRRRAWVVLPPGAGKTRVGLETIGAALADGPDRVAARAVVLAPNTAIQAQWVAQALAHGLDAGTERDLSAAVTCLTYQSLAVFDPDAEVADDPEDEPEVPVAAEAGPDVESTPSTVLLDRLHPNGRDLVARMQQVDGLLLVLDECHHLLEVWGRLLGELLHTLEEARVLGLTATPPDALTADQAALVHELFREVAFRAGVPAVVKEGHLAPFAELAWLTAPTAHEAQWLASEATRWSELTTYLTDPAFGTVPFLEWLRVRFVQPVPHTRTWAELVKAEPVLTAAALRLSHAGLLALPEGARLTEEHRRAPDAADWVALLDDWVVTHVSRSEDPRDAAVLESVRAALPSVGYLLTKRGVRRGRTPVDRVLARSAAKTTAAVEIVAHEVDLLGPGARVLVLCDHERASATLPTGLQGVIDAQSGSAYATVEALVADPATADLGPLLVTGRTVAGAATTLAELAEFVGERVPRLAGRLEVREGDGKVAELAGPWTSRAWVGPVTEFFEEGRCQVLVGTRGLLGEGWDARRITGLVDLTTATTLTAVVQTRGRALRTDPAWTEKVAVNWTVVCVTEDHPTGGKDWARLVRKHEGFHGVDDDGDIVDGVAHIDPAFSPYAPPPVADFDALNARMRVRAAGRDEVRDRWRVGEPYRDQVAATLRIVSPAAAPAVDQPEATVTRLALTPAPLAAHAEGIEVRDPAVQPPPRVTGWRGALVAAASWPLTRPERAAALRDWVTSYADAATATPSLGRVAAAVADALHAAGLTGAGADAVVVEVHPGGEHRCRLDTGGAATEEDAAAFATALDEALAPVAVPRYVVSRYALSGPPGLRRTPRTRGGALAALRGVRPDGEVWHPVPAVLGVNAKRAGAYREAWTHWIGGGRLLFTGSPEGAGVLAAQQGADPFAATTVLRRHWL
ncbi:DEAD/DEAH box helicase family protein [Nocardioides sp. GCM10027113]|uniref:DEAD/DEAH box helicase family protein n=1 Tax=unclassified Nocardioides TaxID=2615069 RepID=UPI00360F2210